MKICKHTVKKYMLITLIPAAIFTLLFGIYRWNGEQVKIENQAQKVAMIHQKQIDQFISETITGLEVMALTLESNNVTSNELKKTLEKTGMEDPRYSGLYYLDANYNIITGTNDNVTQFNLSNKHYIKKMLHTRQTTVSEQLDTLTNNQKVVVIATPVYKEEELEGVFIALLRSDYIINIMKVLTPGMTIKFENTNGVPIFGTENIESIQTESEWVTVPLDRVPWNVATLKNDEASLLNTIIATTIFFFVVAAVFHLIFLLFYSISLKKQAERERLQNEAQKLELVGTLAASTAHEIRNPLTGIKGLVQLLSEKHNDKQDQFYFSVIEKEISRINQIVSEFLILGKPTMEDFEIMNLKDVVLELNPIIESEVNLVNVEYELNIKSKQLEVLGVRDQMKQVILNIIKNALESIEEEGKLSLELSEVNRQAVLTISDTGVGITEQDLEKIFEPFFTSKECGTGLGLVVCRRIIESFGGEINISSNLNKGTSVEISLPLAKE